MRTPGRLKRHRANRYKQRNIRIALLTMGRHASRFCIWPAWLTRSRESVSNETRYGPLTEHAHICDQKLGIKLTVAHKYNVWNGRSFFVDSVGLVFLLCREFSFSAEYFFFSAEHIAFLPRTFLLSRAFSFSVCRILFLIYTFFCRVMLGREEKLLGRAGKRSAEKKTLDRKE